MHRVLCIDEIVSLVFFQLREITQDGCQATLAAAAQVCKAWKEPALDCLWYNLVSMRPLAHILPKGVYKTMKNGSLVLERPMTPDEFAFVLNYTRRTRRLELHSCQRMPFIKTVLVSNDRIFPNLDRLYLKEGTVENLFHARPLLGLPLSEIRFSRLNMDRDLARCEDVVQAFFDKLNEDTSRLRTLEFVLADGGVDYGDIEDRFIDTIKRSPNLTRVRVGPQSQRLIRALGQLPQLKTLHLEIREGPRSSMDEPSPVFDAMEEDLAETPFPTLEHLVLNCESRMSTAARLLAGQGLFAKKSIMITSDYFCEEPGVLSLIQAVVHPTKSSSLETFHLDFKDVGDITHIRFSGPLNPLLSIHELRDVVVEIPVPVIVDNDSLRRIADAWPRLVNLSFDTGNADLAQVFCEPEADLGGVAELSRCRNLQALKLFFRADSVRLTSSTLAVPPCFALQRISVGSSPIKSTARVARLLRERFPKLTKITPDPTGRDGSPGSTLQRAYSHTPRRWKEVEKMVKGPRTVQRAASEPL